MMWGTISAGQMEFYNPNYVGVDIGGGALTIDQFLTRAVARRVPYVTPVKDLYICSSSTLPGGDVHGICCYHAAKAVIKELE